MVEIYYSFMEDLDLIYGENFSWEVKSNYIWKKFVSFSNNREWDTLRKNRKRKKKKNIGW